MNINKLLWLLIVPFLMTKLYAGDGLKVRYQTPFIPLEISVDKNGFDFSLSRDIIIPLGKFNIGYSTYKAKFKKEYTYIIIEDIKRYKEYIYKVKNKKSLRLLNKRRKGVKIKRNKIRIIIERGSEFKLKFEVIDKTSSISKKNHIKWINPTKKSCRYKARGEISSDGICEATWKNANKICEVNNAHLPTLEELEKEVKKCEGKVAKDSDKNWDTIVNKNNQNAYYQKCYKKDGFNDSYYWSATTNQSSRTSAWIVNFNYGYSNYNLKLNSFYVRCIR